MSKVDLRLRKVKNSSIKSASEIMSPTGTQMNHCRSDDINSNNDDVGYEDTDDVEINDTKSGKNKIGKFTKNDKSDMVKLIYDGEVAKYSKNDENDMDSDENDGLNDAKPLIHFKNIDDSYEIDLIDKSNQSEHILSLSFQVFIPFLIAGFGTVGAGLVLDVVQHWDVFRNVSEVFILVPALLGLKGNLEMTLASRLSTQANLGNMISFKNQWIMASGNIALIQCQAAVVGFLSALFAILMDWLPEGDFNYHHALLLCASSLLTASIASFLLGLVMIGVVIISYKCEINPDNVATPIAASLGDLTTLALLAHISNSFYYTIDTSPWICTMIIVLFLLLIPLWCYIAKNNRYTREVLFTGWTPVISAMAISSIGGCILDFAVSRFKGIAVFQPVINGVGGNLVAVQASRISTYLHQRSKLGNLPKTEAKLCFSPCDAFFKHNNIHARTARVLLFMVIPGHLIFTYGIKFLQAGHTSVTLLFLVVYLSAALLQVFLLLYFAHIMILWMWVRRVDPDNSAIPYLTALGDLLGTALLAIAFLVLFSIGDKDADVGD